MIRRRRYSRRRRSRIRASRIRGGGGGGGGGVRRRGAVRSGDDEPPPSRRALPPPLLLPLPPALFPQTRRRLRRSIAAAATLRVVAPSSIYTPPPLLPHRVVREHVRVLGEVEVGDGVEPPEPDRLRVVRHRRLLLRVVQPQVPVLLPDELTDARLPPTLLVPGHAAEPRTTTRPAARGALTAAGAAFTAFVTVFAHPAAAPLTLSPEAQDQLVLVDVVERRELLPVVVHVEVGRRVVAAALHGGDVVRQRRLRLRVEPAEVHLLPVLPDVRLPATRAAVVRHAAVTRRAPRTAGAFTFAGALLLGALAVGQRTRAALPSRRLRPRLRPRRRRDEAPRVRREGR